MGMSRVRLFFFLATRSQFLLCLVLKEIVKRKSKVVAIKSILIQFKHELYPGAIFLYGYYSK